ncbi:Toll-interacting protein [Frankliniella occidentalis]|uniref:Toll-interacting protein-like n=1 Tax=Frankliniella occidentalis TaxID=133901 RepID=A0A6J1S7A4_FRAOC|nr:toll-interacting protein-like [Frankliniella occidentalis]KAE8746750.1 Toll-interacting protein [Frankliniella occidentalis]
MAAAADPNDKNAERRKRVFLGSLPPDFLRVAAPAGNQQQEAADQQAALALHQQQLAAMGGIQPTHQMGRLNITIAQAKLAKNYGLARMDPYVRLRIGHFVLETHTDPNGGKNPRWNKIVQCPLPPGINSIVLEIFDECSFTMDELIAWAEIPITEAVLCGETHEDWYPLSGKQGEGMEGMINLVLSYATAPIAAPYAMPGASPMMMVPTPAGYGTRAFQAVPVYTQAPAPVPVEPPQLSEDDLKQISEMFPNMDKEVIKSVAEANQNNKTAIVNSLLQMAE